MVYSGNRRYNGGMCIGNDNGGPGRSMETGYRRYWWQNDDGSYPTSSWHWLDGNGDGISECYYFDGNGYMAANTTTPDGYTVDGSGAWVVDGVVQTQGTQTQGTQSQGGGTSSSWS